MENKVQDAEYWKNRQINDEERDWKTNGENWVEDYVLSKDHPHRDLIINALKEEFEPLEEFSVLEIGCNTGPNLIRIHQEFENAGLSGIDVSELAIQKARELLPDAVLGVADYHYLDEHSKQVDVIIADAVLMYSDPEKIGGVLDIIAKLAKQMIIIIERVSETEENNGYIWSRNYPQLMKDRGCEVEVIKLDETTWPHSEGWKNKGYVIVCRLPQKNA